MKTARMVIGIVSIVLFAVITMQSCAAGTFNTLQENGESGGSAGFLLALCMLVAGIVAIAAKRSKSGSIVAGCFYLFGGLVGIAMAGSYSDLKIWSVLSFIFAAVFVIGGIRQKEKTLE